MGASELHRLLLEAITEAQAAYVAAKDPKEVFDGLLAQLLRLTASDYGYIGEVLRDEQGLPYLKTHAITNLAWNDETRKFYEDNAPTGLEFRNLKTLFGHVLTSRDVVIANAPKADPRAGGLPEGHPPLDAYLGIPFFAGPELIGSAGISNRAGGYDAEIVDFLRPFNATCANIILAERAKREHRRVEHLKSEFVAVVSHELRTPMTSIRGAVELLYNGAVCELPEEAMSLVKTAQRNVDRTLRLLDDLLDVERLATGSLRLRLGECDLCALVQGVQRDMAPLLADAQIGLFVEAPEAVTVVADPDRMKQVLTNLVGNSIKFSSAGTTIKVSVRDTGDVIELVVRDEGAGMSAADLSGIFDRFSQVEASATRSGSGVGLGLFVVKNLVEQHGGRIEVESELGVGTTFRLLFEKGWSGVSQTEAC